MSNELTLVPLADVVIELREPFVLPDTPAGTRMVFEAASARYDGDRLRGTMLGAASADWLTVGPDGTGSLDVRGLLETDDGATIFVHYTGRVDVAGDGAVYATPRFDTGDPRYGWLNKVQAVGKGRYDGATLTYQLYELR